MKSVNSMAMAVLGVLGVIVWLVLESKPTPIRLPANSAASAPDPSATGQDDPSPAEGAKTRIEARSSRSDEMTGLLSLHVFDEQNGRGIPGARAAWCARAGGITRSLSSAGISDENGNLLVTPLPSNVDVTALPSTSAAAVLIVTAEGYLPIVSKSLTGNVGLHQASAIEGFVISEDTGLGVPNVTVFASQSTLIIDMAHVESDSGFDGHKQSARTDASGAFKLRGLLPGRYSVGVASDRFIMSDRVLEPSVSAPSVGVQIRVYVAQAAVIKAEERVVSYSARSISATRRYHIPDAENYIRSRLRDRFPDCIVIVRGPSVAARTVTRFHVEAFLEDSGWVNAEFEATPLTEPLRLQVLRGSGSRMASGYVRVQAQLLNGGGCDLTGSPLTLKMKWKDSASRVVMIDGKIGDWIPCPPGDYAIVLGESGSGCLAVTEASQGLTIQAGERVDHQLDLSLPLRQCRLEFPHADPNVRTIRLTIRCFDREVDPILGPWGTTLLLPCGIWPVDVWQLRTGGSSTQISTTVTVPDGVGACIVPINSQ